MEGTTRRWLGLLAMVIASVAVADVTADYTKVLSKRDLVELGNMISSVTGKSLLTVYTSYNGYGCYCGIGGKGTPVDDVDRCCQKHDRCFGAAQKGLCSGSKTDVYSQSYKYSTKDKANKDDGINAMIECAHVSSYSDNAQGRCATAICNCDRDVAACLAKHKHNSKYNHYDKSKCK